MAGVEDMSKIILLEDPASKERKLEEMKKNQGMLKAYEAVAKVRAEVDKLCQKVFLCTNLTNILYIVFGTMK